MNQFIHHVPHETKSLGGEAAFLQTEEAQQLINQIQQHLSENEAKAILYRYQHECTLEETADKMGLQPKTISRYVSVGLKKIREIVKNKERADKP